METGKMYPPSNGEAISTSATQIRGRVREIVLAFLVMTVPMLVFTALLLGLIYHFRIEPTASTSKNLNLARDQQDKGAVLVAISATTLTIIASWSSTIAPLLVVYALTLASYPTARRILLDSQSDSGNNLPTPYQFALVTRMIVNATPSSLWQWLTYYVGWRNREPQTKPLRAMATILTLGLLLSAFVFATDTWLHFTTHTIALTQVEPANVASINGTMRLTDRCFNVETTFQGGCTLNAAATATFLYDSDETLPLLVNSSNTAMVKTYASGDDQYAYIGMPPLPILDNVDFTAKSYAVKSKCQPVTAECISEDGISGPMARYKCPFAMEGSIDTNPTDTIKWAYFTDSSGSDNSTTLIAIQNPYYYAAIFSVNQNLGHRPYISTDPQMQTGLHGSTLFAAFCAATVYDLEYSFVNGTVTRFVTTLSNHSMANILQGTQQYTQVGSPYVLQAAAVAAQNSNSATEVGQKLALAYSQAALAVAAGAIFPASPIEAQRRDSVLVARVPVAPLYALVVANLLLVLLGVVLTLLALLALREKGTGDVQARLNVAAIVAGGFERARGEMGVESVEKLFEERMVGRGPRIGVQRTEGGGWRFVGRMME